MSEAKAPVYIVDGKHVDAHGKEVDAPKQEQAGDDLDGKSVEELQAMADERKLEVQGTGAQGRVLKADLVKALQG